MLADWGLPAAITVFLLMAVTIGVAGTLLAGTADRLADRTRMGEAFTGLIFLAAATSLPDFAATFSAAIDRRAELAMSNITGSMAANLAFLGIADVFYRRANLEHAAASSVNLVQAVLFITLLSIPLIAALAPELHIWAVHPATFLVLLAYLLGIRLIKQVQDKPMWWPRQTPQTVDDHPQAQTSKLSLRRLWAEFVTLAAVMTGAGWMLMDAAQALADDTGLSDGIAGGLLTALSTSLPELFTTIAAVRQGAVTLAVSNIVGTNFFNVVVMAGADVVYRGGSIYHAMSTLQIVWGLIVILMTSVLLLGLVRRETFGIGRIGFESFSVLVIYAFGIGMLFLW